RFGALDEWQIHHTPVHGKRTDSISCSRAGSFEHALRVGDLLLGRSKHGVCQLDLGRMNARFAGIPELSRGGRLLNEAVAIGEVGVRGVEGVNARFARAQPQRELDLQYHGWV